MSRLEFGEPKKLLSWDDLEIVTYFVKRLLECLTMTKFV
jgi:hypothetical protein